MKVAAALSLGLLSACTGNRYAIPDGAAAERHHRTWLVVQEPPPEPVPSAPPVVASAEAVPAAPSASPLEAVAVAGDAPATATEAPEAQPEAGSEAASSEEATTPPAEVPPAEPAPAAEPPSVAPPTHHEQVDLSRDISAEPVSPAEPEPPKLRRMVWGLSMRLGGTFGSDDFIVAEYTDGSTQTLTTGGGVNFFLGTTVTPFKVGGHVLTVGFEGGWKSSSIGENSDTDITFSRNVFMPRVQYGYELTPAILWIVGAGAQYETDIELKVSGAYYGRTQLDNSLGFFGESGFWLDVGLFGMDLTLRRTQMTYRAPDLPSLDADSFGVFGSIHIGLLKTENSVGLDGKPQR